MFYWRYLLLVLLGACVGSVGAMKQKEEPDCCAICLQDFSQKDVQCILPCGHCNFHWKCIGDWLEKKTTCPVCRKELPINFLKQLQELGQKRKQEGETIVTKKPSKTQLELLRLTKMVEELKEKENKQKSTPQEDLLQWVKLTKELGELKVVQQTTQEKVLLELVKLTKELGELKATQQKAELKVGNFETAQLLFKSLVSTQGTLITNLQNSVNSLPTNGSVQKAITDGLNGMLKIERRVQIDSRRNPFTSETAFVALPNGRVIVHLPERYL